MAFKTKTKPEEETTQRPAALVPVQEKTYTPAAQDELMREMQADAGLGVSTKARDNITPSISVLQPQSPMVLDGDARPGDFLITNTGAIDGKEGFVFQPVCMTEWWFEFIPRDQGGGFVARYPVEYDEKENIIPPPGAELKDPDHDRFHYWFPDSGHECTHYRFIPGILWNKDKVGLEYVIQFHGTGHTVARQWNTAWAHSRFQDGPMAGHIKPACSNLYKVRTEQRSNKKGTWYQLVYDRGRSVGDSEELVGDPKDAYRRGKMLAKAFKSGEKVEGVMQETDNDEGSSGQSDPVGPTAGNEEMPY